MTSFCCSPTRRLYALTTAAAALVLVGCTSQGSDQPDPAGAAAPQPRILFQGNGPDHILIAVANLDGSDIGVPTGGPARRQPDQP